MASQKDDDKYVYARVNFRGYIPELNRNGPIKAGFITKEEFKTLVMHDYDAVLLNREACPEFYDQMDAYRSALRANDYAKAAQIADDKLFADDPNSLINKAITAANQGAADSPIPTGDLVGAILSQQGILTPAGTDIITDPAYAGQIAAIQISGVADPLGTSDAVFNAAQPDLSGSVVGSDDLANDELYAAANLTGTADFGDVVGNDATDFTDGATYAAGDAPVGDLDGSAFSGFAQADLDTNASGNDDVVKELQSNSVIITKADKKGKK